MQEELRSAGLAGCPLLGLNRSGGLAQFSLSLPTILGRWIMMRTMTAVIDQGIHIIIM